MSKKPIFHLADRVIVRVAELVAPNITRSALERALVRAGLFSLDDFHETNYGWNKTDFITYTLQANSYSREAATTYLGAVRELLPDAARTSLHSILAEEGISPHTPSTRKRYPRARAKPVSRTRQLKRPARKRELFLAHSSANTDL